MTHRKYIIGVNYCYNGTRILDNLGTFGSQQGIVPGLIFLQEASDISGASISIVDVTSPVMQSDTHKGFDHI